ncbi:hypothetical protein FIA58_020820 [Flavobacterium jejuense]|uniref:GLPGLI family protein n=1 Tax=Flavobacterium jejuense TaxID=1544455 RepID=A0ABX0IZ72_9FLAO|nr:hypothetical protein [Flavobacterium jejuense]NHN28129.1 hypothetical protein [Flavobacterium jejuense]
MNKIFILIFSALIFYSAGHKLDSKRKKYFEGEIIYKIEYEPYEEKYQADRIKELIGSKMVLTFKHGNYKKEYFSPDGKLLQKRVLKLKDKKSYFKTYDSDTIYWIDITVNESKTQFKQLNDTVILNHPCNTIRTKTVVTGENFGGQSFEVGGVFNYAQDLAINPKWYEDYKEGNFNEIAELAKGVSLRTINEGVYWEQKIVAVSINRRKVKKSEFDINLTDKPVKKL